MADQMGPASEGGKPGGIPLWLLIGGAVVVGGFLYFRSKSGAGQGTTPALTTGVATDPNTGLPVDPLTGLPYLTNPTAAPTNESWAAGAEQWAASHGIGAALANQALFDYLNGNSLSGQEADVLNKILSGFGFPPVILPFNGTVPPGPTSKPPKPAPKPPVGTPKPTPKPIPKINAGAFPKIISVIKGPKLIKIPKGGDVVNGAPVYAIVNSIYGPLYEQGQAVTAALAHGGQLYTLPQFAKNIKTPAPAHK